MVKERDIVVHENPATWFNVIKELVSIEINHIFLL